MNDETVYVVFAPSPSASPAPVEGVEGAGGVDIPVAPADVVDVPVDAPVEVVVVEELLGRIVEIVGAPQEVPNFMEVPFTEYSVTDGLLLLLLLSAFFAALWKIIKGVF